MNDAEVEELVQARLNEVRTKMLRIAGHENLSQKQSEAMLALSQEAVALDSRTDLEELFKLFK
jgi:hypothetical protein